MVQFREVEYRYNCIEWAITWDPNKPINTGESTWRLMGREALLNFHMYVLVEGCNEMQGTAGSAGQDIG